MTTAFFSLPRDIRGTCFYPIFTVSSTPTPILTTATDLRERIRNKTVGAIQATFPLDLKGKKLEVHDLRVHEREFSPEDERRALLTGGTLVEPIKGTLRVTDAEGKTVHEAKNFTLAHLPYLTARHTLISDGNEYQVANQLRRKPGVYVQRADNGELRAVFNLGKGKNFDLGFEPAKGTFHLEYGTSKVPLYPVLRALGLTHEDVAKHLGAGVADENAQAHGKHIESAVQKLYHKLEHPSQIDAHANFDKQLEAVRKRYDNTSLDPHVTEHTLGRSHEKVTPNALLDAAKKVLAVHQGRMETDDTDALSFKTFHALDDFLAERIRLTARAWAPKAKYALSTGKPIREVLRPGPFTEGLRKFVTTSNLTAVPTGINPLELIDHAVKVTSLGEGGIPSDRAIPFDARMIHNTHFGALDPIRTPESFHSGVDIRATIAAHRDESGNIYRLARNIKTGKEEFLKAGDLRAHVIAFPGQELKGTVDAFVNGEVQRVDASRVTHQVPHVSHLYSPATAILPLIHSMQGNRAIMASKMGTQALPLVEREVPFVQTKSHLPGEVSFERIFGHMSVPSSPVDGTVHKIEGGWIYIKPHKQEKKGEGLPKIAEDRPVLTSRKLGPLTLNVEMSRHDYEPKPGRLTSNDAHYDYGHHPGYQGLDGDSVDFFFGDQPHGHLGVYEKHRKNSDGTWSLADHKFLAGMSPEDLQEFQRRVEEYNKVTPDARYLNYRAFGDYPELLRHLQAHFEERDEHAKHAAKDDEGLTKVPYQNMFPFPSKTYLHHDLLVKPGDAVKAGQRLGESNFTRDGTLALGKNLSVAYMAYHGLNSNDAVVISEGAAKKLTSEHMYREIYPLTPRTELSLAKHQMYFGTKYTPAQYAVLDPHGVVKKGSQVHHGDLLVAGIIKAEIMGTDALLGRISKSLAKPYREVALTWTHGSPGEVVEVVQTASQIAILVKTREQMQVGDKLAGRHGNKGVVSKIVPDHEMVRDEQGRPIDVLLTSAGVVSRINPSQVIETALGKVVEKTGKPFIYDNNVQRNAVEYAEDVLKQHGIKAKEHLYDPLTRRTIKGTDGKGVFVGRQYIYKLFKSTDTNFSGHGVGPYDLNEQPLKTGGEDSAKGFGKMEFDSLIAHNARNLLREAATVKGTKNDEYWKALQLGAPLPEPKVPFAFHKFTSLLEGAGLKVDKRGSKMVLLPLTDRDVLSRSAGPLAHGKTLIAKNLQPEKGGLFDPRLTGGPQGTLYSHIELPEPIPHPVFKEPVRRILGLSEKDFEKRLAEHGGGWFHEQLKAVDVSAKLKQLRTKLDKASGAELNDTVKQIKYLEALQRENLKPHEAYVISKVPVVPPVFRPITPQPNDPSQLMVADANKLYAHIFDSTHTLKNTALESDRGAHRRQVFNAVAALYGTEDVENDELRGQKVKGFLSNIAGVGTPKGGFFQRKLMRRTQDVSGRGTAVPDPNLGMDDVGVPEQMLWQMYDKLIVARLVRQGYGALDARERVTKRDPVARAAMLAETRERPVLLNRAPTLHRWSIVAAYPTPVAGKTLRINPFIEKGMNLDYDGDNQDSYIIVALTPWENARIRDSDTYLDYVRDSATVLLPGGIRLARLEASVAARFCTDIPTLQGCDLVLCDLAEFPRGEKVAQKGHITFYEVPENVSVLAYDEVTGRVTQQHPTLWSHHAQRERYIVTLTSGRQIFSDDDPRAVYGVDSELNYLRRRPGDSVGVFVPVSFGSVARVDAQELLALPATASTPELPLDSVSGHLLGMLVGNGWVDNYRLNLAGMDAGIQAAFREDLQTLYPNVEVQFRTYEHGAAEGFGDSLKTTATSVPGRLLSERFEGVFGSGAPNKHLPTWFLGTSYSFRLGLLAGLLDTDGSIASVQAASKKKPQWLVNYSSRSGRLAREIVLLAQSLGVRALVTPAKTPGGLPHYIVNFSTVEMAQLKNLPLRHTQKRRNYEAFLQEPPEANSSYNATNLIPVPEYVTKCCSRLYKNGSSSYTKWYQSRKKGYVSRAFAIETLADHPELRENPSSLLQRWIALVDNTSVRWDRVVSFEKTGIKEDGYDLTVPGYETFMNVEGVILSNTLQVHAPVGLSAIDEAKHMTLSNMLLADQTRNKILAFPQHEAIIAFTHASKVEGKGNVKHFASEAEVEAAYRRGELSLHDQVEIGPAKR